MYSFSRSAGLYTVIGTVMRSEVFFGRDLLYAWSLESEGDLLGFLERWVRG